MSKSFNLIISGQPRCGKSTLVRLLKLNKNYLSVGLDAKFSELISQNYEDSKISTRDKINKIINKKIYSESKKKNPSSLAKELNLSVTKCREIIQSNKKISYENLLINILNLAKQINNRYGWIISDLRVEENFRLLKKIDKSLKIIFLFRCPVESITASLFWRDMKKKKNSFLIQIILRWKLSFYFSKYLKNKFPNDVDILIYNNIKNSNTKSLDFSKKLNLTKYFRYDTKKSYFNYCKKEGWLLPNKLRKHVLDTFQLELIMYNCYLKKKIKPQKYFFEVYFSSLFIDICFYIFKIVGNVNISLSYRILDFLSSPFLNFKNFLRSLVKFFYVTKKIN